MSAPERLENRLYAALMAAREAQKTLWPEPETSALYGAVFNAALCILATRDSRLLYNYGREVAAGRVAAKVILGLDKFNGRSRFSTWLYRMARNELTDIIREVRARVEVQIETLPDMPAVFHAGTLRLPSGCLSPTQERLVRLRIEGGYNFEELARVLEISPGGAHNLWRNALRRLKSRLTN